jgi:hypothetical protein
MEAPPAGEGFGDEEQAANREAAKKIKGRLSMFFPCALRLRSQATQIQRRLAAYQTINSREGPQQKQSPLTRTQPHKRRPSSIIKTLSGTSKPPETAA